jgi:ACT domain-containing protein
MKLLSLKYSNIVLNVWDIGEKSAFTLFLVLERLKLSYCGQGKVCLNIMAANSINVL